MVNVKKCSWSIERKAIHTWTGVELVHVLNAQASKERQEAILAKFDIEFIDSVDYGNELFNQSYDAYDCGSFILGTNCRTNEQVNFYYIIDDLDEWYSETTKEADAYYRSYFGWA